MHKSIIAVAMILGACGASLATECPTACPPAEPVVAVQACARPKAKKARKAKKVKACGESVVVDACVPACEPVVQACALPEAAATPVVAASPVVAPAVEEAYHVVPVKKTMMVEEVYTVNEKRTKTEIQLRTRTIKPNAPRLVRSAARPNGNVVEVRKDKPREKTYEKKVKVKYEEAVAKTRMVPMQFEEYELIPASGVVRR